jgi:hypothetical protein
MALQATVGGQAAVRLRQGGLLPRGARLGSRLTILSRFCDSSQGGQQPGIGHAPTGLLALPLPIA